MSCAGRSEPIAVIGSGCRFPGHANSPSQLWTVLSETPDVATKIPTDRLNLERFYHPDSSHHGTCNATESYLLDQDIRCFDAGFFAIPPGEAAAMDPQHRLLMETVYESIEAAGLRLSDLRGSDTAVYVGITSYDYHTQTAQDFNSVPTYNATGAAACNASARLSYFFDLHGPCMTIDTACSSSMVAVYQAVQTLRQGTSRVAVAAGTNLLFSPLGYISYSNLHMLSPTGRCQMWDADANGYVRGEGVASLLLKRLSDAIADGDHVDFVIREVGVNQDGRTKGITMPSALAQANLIRETYAKAGLDPHKAEDRCQYFEAHGTGTPVGDPQEAEALQSAFFPNGISRPTDVMYVGSIKTVIGHTESTAGIAGMLKASLAMKHGVIPPNLHFKKLNPDVAPFYNNLNLVTAHQAWPDVVAGQPRRASVNSFGFGGTNGHAILESYEKALAPAKTVDATSHSMLPLVFSAASGKSLHSLLRSYQSYLESSPEVDLRRLAYTLACRKTPHPFRVSVCGGDYRAIWADLNSLLAGDISTSIVRSAKTKDPAILGIFTGQGAQWPQMGAALVRTSSHVRKIVAELDDSLSSLPEADRPKWRVLDELQAPAPASRVAEAAIAQPLTCAVQLILINLLQHAGVQFRAVVGHSSGELAAAHAAGFLTRHDTIRIAYYRGLHSRLAGSDSGQPGGMLAAGLSVEEGRTICARDEFRGRLSVAASNSLTSITLSGDADAVEEVQKLLESDKKFVRTLRVDKAYHSHHMLRVSEAFLESLRACNIRIQTPSTMTPLWFSSVSAGKIMDSSAALDGQYWNENLNRPVLFSQAVEAAVEFEGSFEAAIEIGAHPALQGPASEVYKLSAGQAIPAYIGCLARGKDDVATFSKALGALWATAAAEINFERFDSTINDEESKVTVLQNLPMYPWDHDRVLWSESRKARLVRQQPGQLHALLGTREADGTGEEWHWRNLLTPKELPWLADHALQGQLVFPAAGYISLGLEAAMQVAGHRSVQLVEMTDTSIQKGIAVDDKAGTEILVSLTGIQQDQEQLTASFACFSTVGREATHLVLNTTASLRLCFGPPVANILDSGHGIAQCMQTIDTKVFYDELSQVGYTYGPSFRCITSMQRKLGCCKGTVVAPANNDTGTTLLFHPSMLDSALQGLLACFSYPGDGRLWSLHTPSTIQKVTLVPSLCRMSMTSQVAFDSILTDIGLNKIVGDVEIYQSDSGYRSISVEGVDFKPLSAASQEDDKQLFARTVYDLECPDAEVALANRRATREALQKGLDYERVGFYFLRALRESIDETERRALGLKPHHEALIDYARHICGIVERGKHAYMQLEWRKDSLDEIQAVVQRYSATDPSPIITTVLDGTLQQFAQVNQMTEEDKMANFCEKVLDFGELDHVLSTMINTIAHRFPSINICEIGAGGGRASEHILAKIGTAYSSYTFTDINPRVFHKAQQRLAAHKNHVVYRTLDITSDPLLQGFDEGNYDVIVAANVFHVTPDLEVTLRNARSLLKPGGFLLIMESVDDGPIHPAFIMGCLSQWWVGQGNGRQWRPKFSVAQWNELLIRTGFSGVDTATPVLDLLVMPAAVIVSQAVDKELAMLRNPIAAVNGHPAVKEHDLVLLGGSRASISAVVAELLVGLQHQYQRVLHVASWQNLATEQVSFGSSFVNLGDMDGPFWTDITDDRVSKLEEVLKKSHVIMWVTWGADRDNTDGAQTLGFFRSLRHELPEAQFQVVNFDDQAKLDVDFLKTNILRLEANAACKRRGALDGKLWTFEPEIKIWNGRVFIPRVVPDKCRNDRYNSAKRAIYKEVALDQTIATFSWDEVEQRYELHEAASIDHLGPHSDRQVRIDSSLVSCVSTSVGRLFFSLGTDPVSGERMLSASTSNASHISIPSTWSTPTSIRRNRGAQYLSLFLGYCFSRTAMAVVPPGSCLLVHEADPSVASMLSYQMKKNGRQIAFTTSKPLAIERDWIQLHSHAQNRQVRAALPEDTYMYLDLSSSNTRASYTEALGTRISASLPSRCQRYTASELVGSEACLLPGLHEMAIHDFLMDANSCILAQMELISAYVPSCGVPLSMAVIQKASIGKMSVLDWYAEPTTPIRVQPVHHRPELFRTDRTYWLIGLPEDLGRSLCDFMVSQGVRHIVLTSYKPSVNTHWIEGHRARGVNLVYLDENLADRTHLARAHKKILCTMAPVDGVAIAESLKYASLDSLPCQSESDIGGATHVDQMFTDDALNWFIIFSSISATFGYPKQPLYTRASQSNKALIRRRRSRGAAGSVIEIPQVVGLQSIEQDGNIPTSLSYSETTHSIYRPGTMVVSEPDLHQIFAEAIVAGRPDSGDDAELITGIAKLSSTESRQALWAGDSRFSHFVRSEDAAKLQCTAKAGTVSVQTQLKACKDAEEMRSVVISAFLVKLKSSLMMSDEQIDELIPLIDLGVDSLVAVDLRGWFAHEVGSEVALMKILGGSSAQELVDDLLLKVTLSL